MVGKWLVTIGGYGGNARKPLFGSAGAATKKASTRVPTPHKDVFVLDTSSMTWYQPLTLGTPIGGRHGHCVVSVGPHLLVFGGWEENRPRNDVVQLDTTALVPEMEFAEDGQE
jgi:hypothetical protein